MKKIIRIFFYISLLLMVIFSILNKTFLNMDELWSFSFARNIHNGLIPYKDFNVVSTPLSFFINGFFLMMGDKLINFRIIYFIYYLVFILVISKLFNYLKITNSVKYIFLVVITLFLLKFNYLDYNFLQMIFICFLLLFEIKYKNTNKEYYILLSSLLAGLSIINKQSSGLLIYICFLILRIIDYKGVKELFKLFLISIIPSIIFLIYLIITGSFTYFIDLAVLGLKTFSNNYIDMFSIIFLLLLIISFIILLLLNKKDLNNLIFIMYSVGSISVMYPIVDSVHFILGVIPILIYFFYVISKILKFNNDIVNIFLIFIILFISLFNGYNYFKCYKSNIDIYRYLPSSISMDSEISDISKYIDLNDNVLILDYSASMYMLAANRYNKYFDLFMNGNFGIEGEKEMNNIIKDRDNFILLYDGDRNWQEPTRIKDYVKNNYKIISNIRRFNIYK